MPVSDSKEEEEGFRQMFKNPFWQEDNLQSLQQSAQKRKTTTMAESQSSKTQLTLLKFYKKS